MKKLVSTFLLSIMLSIPAFAVTELTQSNAKELIEAKGLVMLEIYAADCGYCKLFAPVYEQAEKEVKAAGMDIKFLRADTEKLPGLSQALRVDGTPTTYLFDANKKELIGILNGYVKTSAEVRSFIAKSLAQRK